ncbi:MAG: ABC transporter ATP-binding protein [Planctomycetes bacterium]|nr:ABC transporter ATP-binding protein [Planctomycetota bacterium]
MELRGVTKVYRMGRVEVPALRGVDLRVAPGESLAICGPSGSGKSTLLHILGMLDRPSAGSFRFEGQAVEGLADRDLSAIRGQRIGFVFQAFHLLPEETALRNVMLPLVYSGAADRRGRAEEALRRVGLEDRAHHRPAELSGGERQRVAIARALVKCPSVILADEPTGNLDSLSGGQVLEIFEGLHAEGMTLVLITHDAAVASRCQGVVRVRDGLLETAGPGAGA